MRLEHGNCQHGLWLDMSRRIAFRNLRQRFNASDLYDAVALSDFAQQFRADGALDGEDSVSLARAWSDERGVSAVEFGLTAPAFFMLIAGILECGLLLWTQVSLQHA